MSLELGAKLPAEILEETAKSPPRLTAVPLLTVDDEGFPHVALLSYFELIGHRKRLYFFVHSFSRTARFLRARPQCTLAFLSGDFAYYAKGRPRPIGQLESRALFEFSVDSVLQDFASAEEGEAFLQSGLRFTTKGKDIEKRLVLKRRMAELIKA